MRARKMRLFVAVVLALMLVAVMLGACQREEPVERGFSSACYRTDGGDKWICGSGGEFELQSGATLDIQSGAATDFSGGVDLDGALLDLDADGDTSLQAGTDDQIDVEIGGADDFQFTANTFTVLEGSMITLPATSDVSAYGYVNVGDGTPDGSVTAGNDEELYVEGELEVDSEAEFDGPVDADAGMTIDGGVTNVGGGTPDVAAGDDDLYVTGDLEVDNELEVDGTTDLDGAATVQGDLTVEDDDSGGNQGATNYVIGLPRISIVDLAQGTNPGSETVDCMDDSPTGEWAQVDAGTNVTVTADTSFYRYDTNSIKLEVTTVAENDGVDCTIPAQDDLSDLDSVGFWIYSDEALSSGDLDLTVDDSDGTDQEYNVPAVSADVWTWVEIDISGCDANCDTTDGFFILFTAQGAGALSDPDIYIDELYYWDAADEETLGQEIVDKGVISVLTLPTGEATDNTWGVAAEWTDYIIHYESGNDFIVWITDQSANEVLALIAY